MCGRFTRNYTWAQIHAMYSLVSSASNLQPRFNICPTTDVDVVIRGEGPRALVPMRWGLIPGWWKKPLKEMRLATFNARAETVAEKPMFRDSFKRRRCLMPASGYYEWKTTPEGKQPYYFTRRDGAVMTIAAIQDAWVDPVTGEPVRSLDRLLQRRSTSLSLRRQDARRGLCYAGKRGEIGGVTKPRIHLSPHSPDEPLNCTALTPIQI
jgi:putative SOS response-associated peptidase YedK